MTMVTLPALLGGDLDLGQLNRQVRSGEVQLDWSQVEEAPRPALLQLLAGCDLARDGDALGIATISDELSGAIIDVLFNSPVPEELHGSDPPAPGAPDWGENLLRAPSPSEIRQELQDLVLKDLLGPARGAEEEVPEDRVTNRYVLGLLAPKKEQMRQDADDGLAIAGTDAAEEGSAETDATVGRSMFPSSLGLSFIAAPETRALRIDARWGRYERRHTEVETNQGPQTVWKRIPMAGSCELRLDQDDVPDLLPCPQEQPNVVLRCNRRQRKGEWFVSVFLVNLEPNPRRNKDSAWLFQPELTIEDADGGAAFVCRRQPRAPVDVDRGTAQEEQSMAMLYRGYRDFAVGHGVSVHARVCPEQPERADRLETRTVPCYDVPSTDMPTRLELPALDDLVLDMRVLAEMEPDDLIVNLQRLVAPYAAWTREQWRRLEDPAEGLDQYRAAAAAAMTACDDALARITAGVELLRANDRAREAFRFMNRAMWLQRVHTLVAQAARSGSGTDRATFDVPANRSWRLFQLAFILLNLPGITDLDHPERSDSPDATADLLWFPTGGGKTEAYLGLTAYTLAIRRLQGVVAGRDSQYGVAVLMRYTLRLLTLQQFQRAATLICACEKLRRDAQMDDDTRWGQEPFRLGLWVGQKATPNTIDAADEAIKQQHGHGKYRGGQASPAQLTHCPWCGTRIDPGRDILVEKAPGGRGRVFMYCGDPTGECPFSQRQSALWEEGLPLMVVDEEIYHRLPALLISTVDKFAQMPWKGETQMLFGQVNARCERHGFLSPDMEREKSHPAWGDLPRARVHPHGPLRPPDLIIQDELHLISGPLGSLVGIYETAVDHLSSWKVDGRMVRPKVIASTATVRRAEEQMRGIFTRSVSVFPPHGVDIEDNFFARRRTPSQERPGRRYIGIYAPGRRLKAVLIRVYVAHLAAAQKLFERYGAAADPWMTLVGYFSSMRELGGMRRLVEDDVRSRLRLTDEHDLAKRSFSFVEELTSRKGSGEIPTILERLERPFDAQEQAARRSKQNARVKGTGSLAPIDVLLATNMLSVGVDVQRLGLMLVAGQPKNTAEYIQATSRVGRSAAGPGLICTIYNWSRPRDLSHYESFEHYHATFYQQVEALSVTPFAPRARDRALTGVLTALVRLAGPELDGNLAAGSIARDHPLVRAAIETIVRRSELTSEHPERPDVVRAELNERLDQWLREAARREGGRRLGYQSARDSLTVNLLQQPSLENWQLFTCLQSLRDVEPEIDLVLDDQGLDQEPSALQMGPWQPEEDPDEPI